MIWHKKNGHSKKNLRIGVVLSLIFCSLFFSFLFTSNVSAISVNYNDPYMTFRRNNEYGDTGTTSSGSKPFTGVAIPGNVINSNLMFNSNYTFNSVGEFNPYLIRLYTLSHAIQDNSATLSGEYNFVCVSEGGRYCEVNTDILDLAQVGDLRVRDEYNATTLTKNISYVITNWQQTLTSQYQQTTFYFTTVTFYINMAVKGLTPIASGYYSFDIFTPHPFTRAQSNATIRFYSEKGNMNIEYFSSGDDATQKAQLNIMNLQYTLQQQQYNLQQQQYNQDQEDRDNIENRSNDSEQDGDNASQNAENATSSLLGAITSIYDQLLHPHTTNCVIQGVQIYEMNLGNLDFCTGFDIPQPVFAIGALIMIGLIILLAWSILKAGISLYNEILGGKG